MKQLTLKFKDMKNFKTKEMVELAMLTNISLANKDFNEKFGRNMTSNECCVLMSSPNFKKCVCDFLNQLEKGIDNIFNSAG